MTYFTKNLSRHEFACRCGCGFDTADFKLVTCVQSCADHFERKYGKVIVEITGPNRCVEHNEEVQKYYNKNYIPYSSKSQHLYGKAIDFKMKKFFMGNWEYIDPNEVADYLENRHPNKYGIGRYNDRTHFDSRTIFARWDKRQ